MLQKGAGLGMAVPNGAAQGKKRKRGGERSRRRWALHAALNGVILDNCLHNACNTLQAVTAILAIAIKFFLPSLGISI